MRLPSAIAIMASGVAVSTAGPVLLLRYARLRDTVGRTAQSLLVAGAGLAVAGTVSAVAVGLVLPGGWSGYGSRRELAAALVALGVAVGGLLLCAGLLRMPGAADTGGTAFRLVLDGLVIAAALWFVGWVLVSEPTKVLGVATTASGPGTLGPSASCSAILAASVVAAVLAGLTCIVGTRPGSRRRALLLVGGGATLTVGCGVLVAVGIARADSAVTLTATVLLLPTGLLMVAMARRATPAPVATDREVIRGGNASTFLPMLAMATSAGYHLAVGGDFDTAGVVAGFTEGFALVARQYLALNDVQEYAARLAEREAHFRELAHTDPLTGLANRRGLVRAMREMTAAGPPCVLLGLDLDGFKNVNDVRGHDVGDAVLAEVGQRLRANLRPGDIAARLGGDEFAVLMRARPPEAQRVAERLLGVVGRPYGNQPGPVYLSVSIGVADQASAADLQAMLRNADLALRYAKQRGKNRVERYDVAHDRLLRRRTTLEHELRGAIGRGELHLAFQPVVAVPSVRPVGAEALLRWHHPELGSVRPDEFIPLAEECGMIAKLGGWVLHQACHQLSVWLAGGHDVWVSVNVSPKELHVPDYAVRVAEVLRAHRVPPQRLVLEVTEHAVAADLAELVRRLRELRATGVRIALDDFGAGYSSLGQLRTLPIDILKIDHSLVAEPDPVRDPQPGGRAGAPMVDVVMRLGHQLGLEVIAEGVTSPAELTTVVEAGCRFGQGRLFGWGVPAEHLEAMLEAATSPGARAKPAARTTQVQNVRSVDSGREMRQA